VDKTLNRENDCSGIVDSCPGCGRPHTAHPIAKISKVKYLALILLISVVSLSSVYFLSKTGLARKYQWDISIYIMTLSWYFQAKLSWYFRYFQNINLYYYYLLTFLIHAYLTQTAQVPKLLDAAKILTKILTFCVVCNNVTDDRHIADGRLMP